MVVSLGVPIYRVFTVKRRPACIVNVFVRM